MFTYSTHAFAAYVESAMGSAVVNDASAVYFNPAALTLISNPQMVASETFVSALSTFKGTTTQLLTGYTLTGTANSRTYYSLPSLYFSLPVNNRITFGLGALYNFYGKSDFPADSILRYLQTYSYASTLDLMASIGVKATQSLSFGAGLALQYAELALDSMSGFPMLGVGDAKLTNEANARSIGGNIGVLFHPLLGTIIGFTFHSTVSYEFKGHSTFHSSVPFSTNALSVKILTPPSFVLSLAQYVSPSLGAVFTLQRMNWSVVRNLNLKNVAYVVNGVPIILPSVNNVYHLHNTWRFIFGPFYQFTPKLKVRGIFSYDEDPNNPFFQLTPGTNYIVGLGSSYQFSKQITGDVVYAHTFYRIKQNSITSSTNCAQGRYGGGRDGVRFDITVNFV